MVRSFLIATTMLISSACAADDRIISDRGSDFIKHHEGKRLDVYPDVVGIPTVGYGHRVITTDGFEIGDILTDNEIDILFDKDVDRFEEAVNNSVVVRITQNMFDAMVSFSYNIGVKAFEASTFLKKLNKEMYYEAADELDRWVYARGKVIKGLVNRRQAEKELFLEGIESVAPRSDYSSE